MRCAIVTGGGTGIGRATALRLAQGGHAVVVAGRRREPLEDATRAIIAGGGRAIAVTADVARVEQVVDMVRQSVDAFGRIDVLVNNAGGASNVAIATLSDEQWHDTLNVNLSSAFYATRAVWPVMQRQFQAMKASPKPEGGVIVNISSMASKDPFPGLGIYATAKAALNMFTLVTAREGHAVGIRAVCIAPGAVNTGMFRGVMGDRPIPEGIALEPADIAEMIDQVVNGPLRHCSGDTLFIHRKPI
ncbi:MAG TPA: SDR family oxidoreductase [Phycisphaerae bacterium]|jgi:NAD(P)-dependent dehydrogenase (short-subunit alcohol dehydrogenase family)